MEQLRDPYEFVQEILPTRGNADIPRLVIPVGFTDVKGIRVIAEGYDFTPSDIPTEDKIDGLTRVVGEYYSQKVSTDETVLREHQGDVFDDMASFFSQIKDGERGGFVRLPTATGKTVVFVELCKALLETPDETLAPRILVVAPTKDLVSQTVGNDIEKGFARFAPDTRVSTFYGDTKVTVGMPRGSQIAESQVCVTTYKSFGKMFDEPELSKIGFQYQTKELLRPGQYVTLTKYHYPETGRKLIDLFDVIIFDEAHNLLGERTRERAERALDAGKVCVGFSATTRYTESRDLSSVLPYEIHTMDSAEAIDRGLLAPVLPLVVRTDKKVNDSGILNSSGEYSAEKINFLGYDESRNGLIVDAAVATISNGLGTVISCLAGRDKFHPKHISELLGKIEIEDFFTGARHRIRAVAIDSDMPTSERVKHYRSFEAGYLDCLCFIDILTEGWDSQRAKALINARPTRSKVFAQQRLGRILRLTEEHSPLAVVVDMLDEFKEFPPVNSSDLLYGKPIDSGDIVGEQGDYYPEGFVESFGRTILAGVAAPERIVDRLEPLFTEMEALAARFPNKSPFIREEYIDEAGRLQVEEFASLDYLDGNDIVPYISQDIVERLSQGQKPVDTRISRQGFETRTLYHVNDIKRLVRELPEADPNQYFVDDDGEKWLSSAGFKQLLSNYFPTATDTDIRIALATIEGEGQLEYSPILARYLYKRWGSEEVYGCLKLYKQGTYKILAQKLKETHRLTNRRK